MLNAGVPVATYLFLKCSADDRLYFSVFSVDICYNYRNLQERKIHICNSRLQLIMQQKCSFKKTKHYNALQNTIMHYKTL